MLYQEPKLKGSSEEDHPDKVENVNDVPTKHDTKNTGDDLTLHKSCDDTANCGGDGNDRENDADYSGKTKVAALGFLCHDVLSPFGVIRAL